MPKINITEIDKTVPVAATPSTEIVFIPGFSAKGDAPIDTPTLCYTVKEFTDAFGTEAPTFGSDQEYPDNNSKQADGFDTAIIPTTATKTKDKMFKKGDADPSYIIALELLNAGIPVLYSRASATISVAAMYTYLKTAYNKFSNINDYEVMYLTSGGYPVLEYSYMKETTSVENGIAKSMIKAASTRGEAIALLDHINNPARPLTGTGSVFESLETAELDAEGYGAVFTAWRNYKSPVDGKTYVMPGSFTYLNCLAESVKTNPSYLAIAGVTRGLVKNDAGQTTDAILTNAIADTYQPETGVSINGITKVRPYGQVIWGNRTLKTNAKGLTATSYLNIRKLVCIIKKDLYAAATKCMFEQNSSILWINFKSMVTPLLDQLSTSSGITGYKLVQMPSDNPAKIVARLTIYPIYAVEAFDITIELASDATSIS